MGYKWVSQPTISGSNFYETITILVLLTDISNLMFLNMHSSRVKCYMTLTFYKLRN